MQAPRWFEAEHLRLEFPALQQSVQAHPLAYLDNAATTQKPRAVLLAMQQFYEQDYSNVHRGVHTLSVRATEQFEASRRKVQQFIGAASENEIVFVRGATEAINLVAQSYARVQLKAGDEILVSEMEHHSNLVPWQLVAAQTGAQLKVIPVTETGELCVNTLPQLLTSRTRMLAIVHLSNTLGTINPIRELVQMAHQQGAVVLVDGAQAIAHFPVDVQALDCDFYVFSSHKMYGPSGVGILYGKQFWLDKMPPWQGGGNMISQVTFEKTEYRAPPHRFEAGTPPIAEVIGLGAAIDWLSQLDFDALMAYEDQLLSYATQRLAQEVPGLRLIGTAQDKAAVLNFVLEGIHAHDLATILDSEGVAVRAGHHCTMPLMQRFSVPATVRASLGCYNTKKDIEALVQGLKRARQIFA